MQACILWILRNTSIAATFDIVGEAEAVPDLDVSFDITRKEVQPQDSIRESNTCI